MSNDTKLRTVITAILTVPARRLHALTEMAKNLAGPEGETWHIALNAQLKAGTADVAVGIQHTAWQQIYNKYFPQLKVTVPVFADVPGKVGIYVAQGLTCNMVYTAWNFGKVNWINGSIDAKLDQSREARKASQGSYFVRVGNTFEPDEQFLGKSIRTVDLQGTIGITLLERILLELMHFEAFGKHLLDVSGVTFCSGSLYLDGDVPSVCLYRDCNVSVNTYGMDDSHGRCGVREAVLESL